VDGNQELTQEVEQHLQNLVEMIGPIEAKVNNIFTVWIAVLFVCIFLLIFAELSSRIKLATINGGIEAQPPLTVELIN
jgi:hypothetical protein